MPSTAWFLTIRETDQDWVKIEIDPAVVSGQKGRLGRTLCFPYTLSVPGRAARVMLRLVSVEGWLGLSGESDFVGRIRIPSQVISNNPNKRWILVPVTDVEVEAIEEARNGEMANFTLWLAGLTAVTPATTDATVLASLQKEGIGNTMPVESGHPGTLTIGREHWLTVLQGLGSGTRRLVELPEARLPVGGDTWAECLRLLDEATRFHRTGSYEQVLVSCRRIAEGIPQVMCSVWGIPQKKVRQSVRQWLQDVVEPQLAAAWPEDKKAPVLLRTLLTGVWEWAADAPHYGTEMPLREKSAVALGLCTDLLHFAGQVLQAHPDPIVAAPSAAAIPGTPSATP